MSIRKEIASEVHARLIAAEDQLDDAVSAAANLAAFMPQARKSAHLAAEAGQEALEEMHRAVQNLIEARKCMIGAHNKLSALAEEISLPPQMFGGAYGKASARALELVDERQAA